MSRAQLVESRIARICSAIAGYLNETPSMISYRPPPTSPPPPPALHSNPLAFRPPSTASHRLSLAFTEPARCSANIPSSASASRPSSPWSPFHRLSWAAYPSSFRISTQNAIGRRKQTWRDPPAVALCSEVLSPATRQRSTSPKRRARLKGLFARFSYCNFRILRCPRTA